MIRPMCRYVMALWLALSAGVHASPQAQEAKSTTPTLTKERLAAEVSAEVLNRELLTKVPFGSVARMRHGGLTFVNTEVRPDGNVLEVFRWGLLSKAAEERLRLRLPPDYRDDEDGWRWYRIAKGTRVRVTEVRTTGDRLELDLTTVPGDAPGRLSLKLGKDYEKKYDIESVLTLAGTALRINRVETRLTLASRFVELQRLIASVREAMSASTTPNDRFKRAGILKALLQDAIRNRLEMESATQRPAPEMQSLKRDLADTELTLAASTLEIERMETQRTLAARFGELQQRIATARAAMSASTTATDRLKQAGELKTLLQEAIRNRAEVESATKQPAPEMESLKADLVDTESKIAALPAAVAAERVTNAQTLLASAVAEGEGLRKRATTPGKTMAEWQARRDAVTRWIPNAQKRQALLKTLADLGSADPTQEAAVAEELRAAQALMASLDKEKVEAQLHDLRATYQEMVRTRTQVLDAYTRAYGTPKQREAAQQLITHLQRMYENRTAAAALGDARATAEAAALQGEIEKRRRQ